jgi:hypothetical protein
MRTRKGLVAEMRGLSVAALLRTLVREEAARLRISRSDWTPQAETAQEYYAGLAQQQRDEEL